MLAGELALLLGPSLGAVATQEGATGQRTVSAKELLARMGVEGME